LGKLAQLLGAFRYALLELELVLLGRASRRDELLGHAIERLGKRVELANAAARNGLVNTVLAQTARRVEQAPDRNDDAAHGADRDQQHDDQRAAREPPDEPPLLRVGLRTRKTR